MISKTELKSREFNDIEDYFDYIHLSHKNGQHQQEQDLMQDLSKKQKIEFLSYAKEMCFYRGNFDKFESKLLRSF